MDEKLPDVIIIDSFGTIEADINDTVIFDGNRWESAPYGGGGGGGGGGFVNGILPFENHTADSTAPGASSIIHLYKKSSDNDNLYFRTFGNVEKSLTNITELPNLINIQGTTISSSVWSYVSALNQSLANSSNVSFRNVTSVGDLKVQDLSDNVVLLASGSTVTITGNLSVSGNVSATGNVSYTDIENLRTSDPQISLGRNNLTNLLDLGFYVTYSTDATNYKYSGFYRDRVSGNWKLYDTLLTEPTTTVSNSYTLANLDLATLTGTVVSATTLTGTLSTVSQPNITTLAGLTSVSGVSINSTKWGYVGSMNQSVATTSNVTFGNIAGTITTASQPNITSLSGLTTLGTLTGLNINGTITITDNTTTSIPTINVQNYGLIKSATVDVTDTGYNTIFRAKSSESSEYLDIAMGYYGTGSLNTSGSFLNSLTGTNGISNMFLQTGDSSQRLLIGTVSNSLNTKIVLGGTTTATDILYISNGSAASPSLAFANNTTSGFYSYDTNKIGFSSGGNLKMILGSSLTEINNKLQITQQTGIPSIELIPDGSSISSMKIDDVVLEKNASEFRIRNVDSGFYGLRFNDSGQVIITGADQSDNPSTYKVIWNGNSIQHSGYHNIVASSSGIGMILNANTMNGVSILKLGVDSGNKGWSIERQATTRNFVVYNNDYLEGAPNDLTGSKESIIIVNQSNQMTIGSNELASTTNSRLHVEGLLFSSIALFDTMQCTIGYIHKTNINNTVQMIVGSDKNDLSGGWSLQNSLDGIIDDFVIKNNVSEIVSFYISTDGNVSIGDSDLSSSGTYKFSVGGAMSAQDITSLTGNITGLALIATENIDTPQITMTLPGSVSNPHILLNTGAGFYSVDVDRINFSCGGINVGEFGNPASYAFSVYNTSLDQLAIHYNSTTLQANKGPIIGFYRQCVVDADYIPANIGNISVLKNNTTDDDYGCYMKFETSPSNGVLDESFRIDSSQNIVVNTKNISGVDTLTASTISGTISTASQPFITSFGSLTSLVLDSGQFTIPNGTVNLPSITFGSDNTTGIFGAIGVFRISNSGTNTLWLNSSNNVTLGTTDLASTTYKLYVNGNSYVNGTLQAVNGFTGTLLTAAQTNITSLGTLTGLSVSGSTQATFSLDGIGDGSGGSIITRSFTSSGPYGGGISSTKARGTSSSPSAVTTGDVLCGMWAKGYNSAGSYNGNTGAIRIVANESFTSSSGNTIIDFATTPSGSISRSVQMTLNGSGGLTVGSTSDLASSTNKIYSNGNAYVNGNLTVTGTLSATVSGIPTSSTGTGLTISNVIGVSSGTNTRYFYLQTGTSVFVTASVNITTSASTTIVNFKIALPVAKTTNPAATSEMAGCTTYGFKGVMTNSGGAGGVMAIIGDKTVASCWITNPTGSWGSGITLSDINVQFYYTTS